MISLCSSAVSIPASKLNAHSLIVPRLSNWDLSRLSQLYYPPVMFTILKKDSHIRLYIKQIIEKKRLCDKRGMINTPNSFNLNV